MAIRKKRAGGKHSGGRQSAAGQLRQSQVVTTFGPGSMVDLPDHAVLIGGLDDWHGERRPIFEDRLVAKVAKVLEVPTIKLYAPPVDSQDDLAPPSGITAQRFPEWFIAQDEVEFGGVRSRPLVHWNGLHKRKYITMERKKVPVVPVRFVQACPNGHISDVDWYSFVHRSFESTCRGQLWLDEGGTSGELAELVVRCEACKQRRPLSEAKVSKSRVLGTCSGKRPWLGRNAWETCVDPKTGERHPNRLLIRSASNAYFTQTLSVIHIPDQDAPLREAVDRVWEDFLQYAEDADDVRRERRKERVNNALADYTDAKVWAELRRRRSASGDGDDEGEGKNIKQVEIETLLSADVLGEDRPDGDFYATARSLDGLPPALKPMIERIVLIHRLREVTAQVGFTRFEAAMTDIDGELDLAVKRAALMLDPTWVPAIENRGEGVFIAFCPEVMQAWWRRPAVKERLRHLERGFNAWANSRGGSSLKWPGGPYLMLHTLSHLLVTAVALECGYSASSIRERVYAGPSGYGILLHTGTSGAEGTLGGLVEVGRRIEDHLLRALELGRLCSNDPVCATHEPDDPFEERYLHGAACHGCVLIAETSCERRNELLDRALVVPTVVTPGAAFFGAMEAAPAGIRDVVPSSTPDAMRSRAKARGTRLAKPDPKPASARSSASRGRKTKTTRLAKPDPKPASARSSASRGRKRKTTTPTKPVSEASILDREDFDEPWWPLLEALAAMDDLQVEPGGDVVSERGRVVGSAFALVRRRGVARLLYLIDGDEREAKRVAAALGAKGLRGLLVRAQEAKRDQVIAALEDDG
ncbi:MAG TPA: DUF1998 domain-containing protein [Nannocystis exedens]|nr:DUF1998 domain-containing protein [Nannocystis exedens]